MKTRREFVFSFAAYMLARPLDLLAQKGRVWRVGFLSSRGRPENPDVDYHSGLPRGLKDLGYMEGKNLVIEWRFADGKYDRFAQLAEELARIPVDVLVTDGTPTTQAAQKVTKTIPIVFGSAGDPVGNGLVATLSRPGGNTTGISLLSTDTSVKQIEMLKSTVPSLSRVAVLLNPSNPSAKQILNKILASKPQTKVEILPIEVTSSEAIEAAFPRMVKEGAGAFIFLPDSFLFQLRKLMADLALRHRMPGMSAGRGFPDAGGLMGYGQNLETNYRRAAVYIDKIFKGARPSDLPVEQPTKLDLIVNKRTARALGIEIPPELLLLADVVIE